MLVRGIFSDFGLRISFGLRYSDFGLGTLLQGALAARQSSFTVGPASAERLTSERSAKYQSPTAFYRRECEQFAEIASPVRWNDGHLARADQRRFPKPYPAALQNS